MKSRGSDHTIIMLRRMAWQRAKGELLSILETFWDSDDGYDDLNQRVR